MERGGSKTTGAGEGEWKKKEKEKKKPPAIAQLKRKESKAAKIEGSMSYEG